MPIPTYEAFMLPLLHWAKDGMIHRLSDAYEVMADNFSLTEADRKLLLESGQPVLYNRVGWAKTYLTKAGLLEKAGLGRFKITGEGLNLLNTNPDKVDVALLNRYPSFVQFKHRTPPVAPTLPVSLPPSPSQRTPEEAIENAHAELNSELAQELVSRILQQSPAFFERLVVDLLVAMGYGGSYKDAADVVGRSGDGGIDGIIKQDRLGLDNIYVQAKRWGIGQSVGRPDVQAFVGALSGHAATKGVFITTSSFSDTARQYVNRLQQRVILVDGETLARYMIEFGIGVSTKETYIVKRLDSDYFEDEG